MEPTAAEIAAWMAESGRGYKAAATEFGLPVARVRSICKAPQKKGTKAPPTALELGDRGAILRSAISTLEADLESARTDGSWGAVKDMNRDVLKLRQQLREWTDEQEAAARTEATDEEILAEVLTELRGWPAPYLEQVLEVVEQRLGLQVA
jgi:hypothetical protein